MKEIREFGRVIWNYLNLNKALINPDCIIGLGSYDLRVANRCAELLKEGQGKFILFSGAEGNWTRGRWRKSEAEMFKITALECGIPENCILIEDRSTNLGDNMRFCKKLLHDKLLFPQKILFVTKPQTQRRVFATLPLEWPEIEAGITSPAINFEDQPLSIHSFNDLINEMIGDLQRIKIYPEQGLQIEQEIPEEVEIAYQALITMGYTNHMIKPISGS